MKYYCLSASTENIGDDIQIIAARKHYPRVDAYVDRDRLARDLPKLAPGKIILNGWYMHRGFLGAVSWPPPDWVDALCVSMHVYTADRRVKKAFSSPESVDFLRRHGPVGARDGHTEAFLKDLGVDAYFSACMTMTLESKGYEKNGPVVLCDPLMHERKYRFLPPETYMPMLRSSGIPLDGALTVTHAVPPGMPRDERFAKAEELLDLYDKASLVVTCRLHCALPCLAMGTPVIFVNNRESDPRFSQLFPILRPTSVRDLVEGKSRPIVGGLPRELPDALTKRCAEFFAA